MKVRAQLTFYRGAWRISKGTTPAELGNIAHEMTGHLADLDLQHGMKKGSALYEFRDDGEAVLFKLKYL